MIERIAEGVKGLWLIIGFPLTLCWLGGIAWLGRVLREAHPELYVELGSPTLLRECFSRSRLVSFVLARRDLQVEDSDVRALSRNLRVVGGLLLAGFSAFVLVFFLDR